MKKLILITAIGLGLSLNAATTLWNFTNGTSVLKAGYTGDKAASAVLANYTVYLISCDEYSQNDLISGLRDGTITKDNINSLASATTDADGKLVKANAKQFTRDDIEVGPAYNYFEIAFASVGSKDYMYASKAKSIVSQEYPAEAEIQIAAGTSINAYLGETQSFDSAGWYDVTATIPEPTSALLAMLGLAGLALRRKQK